MTADQQVPPEVQRRMDAAEAEESLYLSTLHGSIREMQVAQIRAMYEQVTWLRERTVVLNMEVRQRDEELATLRSQLAAYARSEAIDQAAQTSEPREPTPGP